tara:strand:+ start:600 stop:1352 length:753 start_codon:yes stop_codon:yes gene_type:complete
MTQLINGDCIEEMKKLDDNSVDLLFTDLPYSCTNCSWDKPIDLDKFWKEVNRICKINCPMFFCCNMRFGVELINSNPKNYRYEYIWQKSRKVGHLNSGKMRLTSHELIFVFYKKLPVYNVKKYHKHKFLEDFAVKEIRNDDGCESLYSNEKGKKHRFKIDGKIRDAEPRYEPPLPGSILTIKTQKNLHQTQKPVDLINFFIKYYSNEGDTVLDPTMGSGSTGVSCKELNRNFIGIELDEKIFKVAEKRLN